MLSPDRVWKISLEEILISDIRKREGGGVGGEAPESSRVELEAKVKAKSSAFSEDEVMVEPSE